jgi:spore coat polysaccharide biosynthesis predicted glycosyltransferase SpsG
MVLFLISVEKTIGIGHLKRCCNLAEKLKELDFECKFILEEDKYSVEYLIYNNFTFFLTESIFLFIKEDNSIMKKSKVIVLDLLWIDSKITKIIRERFNNIKIMALDYFDMEDSNINTIINLKNHNEFLKNPIYSRVKYLEGVKYGIIRKEFMPFIYLKKKSSNQFKILLTFGGSDPQNYTLKLIPYLIPFIEKKPCFVDIVIGPNFNSKSEIENYIKNIKLDCIKIHTNPNYLPELMYHSDIVISGSGTTAIEVATLGIPSILLPQSLEELNFAKIFKQAGFSEIGSDLNEIFQDRIINYMTKIYTNPLFAKNISYIGKTLCQGNGSQLVCNEIVELYNN